MDAASEQAKPPPVNPNPAPSPRNGLPPPVEHQFRPGHSGNRGGRPKGSSTLMPMLREMARGAVYAEDGEVIKYGDKAEQAAQLFIDAVMRGDKDAVVALVHLIDRTDGPVEKRIEHSGELTTKRVVIDRDPSSQAIDRDPPQAP